MRFHTYKNIGTKLFTFIVLLIFLSACKTVKVDKVLTKKFRSDAYKHQFTGLLVVNPRTKDTVISYNSKKYFIPASNAKIFTLYTALQLLPDSIPAFKYRIDTDTLRMIGTGDPSFLHPYFKDSTALIIAKRFKHIEISAHNLSDDRFGPGWSWDDFDKHYSPERSAFPMYGNVLQISNLDTLSCSPKVLHNKVHYTTSRIRRLLDKNIFYYPYNRQDTIQTPMVMDSLLLLKLWDTLLPGKISITNKYFKLANTKYSIPTDSLLKRMMFKSDNFLAEQTLILASSTFSNNLSSYRVRQYILNNQLKGLNQKPRWVDGSGLSRYNLFTPESIVQVLSKLYQELPKNRLLSLFPAGGKTGTIKKWFKGNPTPYIYAKSGTLGNNYSLSGYLVTKKGEWLIFSFMNNHFTKPTKEIKEEMQQTLSWLRDNY